MPKGTFYTKTAQLLCWVKATWDRQRGGGGKRQNERQKYDWIKTITTNNWCSNAWLETVWCEIFTLSDENVCGARPSRSRHYDAKMCGWLLGHCYAVAKLLSSCCADYLGIDMCLGKLLWMVTYWPRSIRNSGKVTPLSSWIKVCTRCLVTTS